MSGPAGAAGVRRSPTRVGAVGRFINPKGAEIAALYRERFTEHEHADLKPRVAVGVWVICAESDVEARRLASSGRMTFTLLRRGQPIAVPPPERAVEFLAADERSGARPAGQPRSERRAVVGSPETVRGELEDVVAKYGAEEAIVVSITYAHEAWRRSYELPAEAFGLRARGDDDVHRREAAVTDLG